VGQAGSAARNEGRDETFARAEQAPGQLARPPPARRGGKENEGRERGAMVNKPSKSILKRCAIGPVVLSANIPSSGDWAGQPTSCPVLRISLADICGVSSHGAMQHAAVRDAPAPTVDVCESPNNSKPPVVHASSATVSADSQVIGASPTGQELSGTLHALEPSPRAVSAGRGLVTASSFTFVCSITVDRPSAAAAAKGPRYGRTSYNATCQVCASRPSGGTQREHSGGRSLLFASRCRAGGRTHGCETPGAQKLFNLRHP
jgi:hypothetical protein